MSLKLVVVNLTDAELARRLADAEGAVLTANYLEQDATAPRQWLEL